MIPLIVRNRAIRDFYALGYSMRETAAEFGLSLSRTQAVLAKFYPRLIRPVGTGMGKCPAERLQIARDAHLGRRFSAEPQKENEHGSHTY